MKTIEELQKENSSLKELAVFLAKCYQENYDRFASTHIVSHLLSHKNLDPQTKEVLDQVFMNFTTVQTTQYRMFVERLAGLPVDKKVRMIDLEACFPEIKDQVQSLYEARKVKNEEDVKAFDETWIKK